MTATATATPTPTAKPNLLLRYDTMLGVCEAVGEDFGFNPNWLRLAFASVLLFAPVAVIGTYLGLGLAVAFARWISPNRAQPVVTAAAAPLAVQDVAEAGPQRLAA